jgi:hypothetical protein
MNAPLPRYIDPMLFVADNRIIPEKVMIRDSLNEHIITHARDYTPEREPFLRKHLMSACALEYPPFNDDKTRSTFIEAIRAEVPLDSTLSNVVPENIKPKKLPSSSYDHPVAHLVNGEPFAPIISAAEAKQSRDAVSLYLTLELVLERNGYPNILHDAVKNLEQRGIEKPNIEQLFNELRTALSTEIKKVSTAEILKSLHRGGVEGVADYLGVAPEVNKEISGLMDFITPRGFPLNDVINWRYGLAEPHMEKASIAEKINVGLDARVNHLITHTRERLKNGEAIPDERDNEKLVAGMLKYMPPVLSTLFFEEGGQLIFTLDPDLGNLQHMPATGFHITYQSPQNPQNAMRQIFTSQELGLPKNTRTNIHEINHLFYPELIGQTWARHADDLLAFDQERIKYLKGLVDQYVKGDVAIEQKVLEQLNSTEFSVNGRSFMDMVQNSGLSGKDYMLTFIGAVNEAYHYLQMESPTYNRIGTYGDPLDRFREMIPRYSELRYVAHVDHPELIQFIVPGISEMYENMYLPHLEERLNQVRAQFGSRAAAVVQTLPDTGMPYDRKFTEARFLKEWEENVGEVTVRHPAGDNRSVLTEFSDIHTDLPTLDKIADTSSLDSRPPAMDHAGILPPEQTPPEDMPSAHLLNMPLSASPAKPAAANNIVSMARKAPVLPTSTLKAITITSDGTVVRDAPTVTMNPSP